MTWNEVLDVISKMNPEELAKPAQIWPYTGTLRSPRPVKLEPVAGIQTIGHFCGYTDGKPGTDPDETRSSYDGKHHPEDYAFLVDGHPFSDDGDRAYRLNEDNTLTGLTSGKVIDMHEEFAKEPHVVVSYDLTDQRVQEVRLCENRKEAEDQAVEMFLDEQSERGEEEEKSKEGAWSSLVATDCAQGLSNEWAIYIHPLSKANLQEE